MRFEPLPGTNVTPSLAPAIPKESLWAYDSGGVNQIGCVYAAQGFEFDYVGVIFGPDLGYLSEMADWKRDKTKSYDTVVRGPVIDSRKL